MKIYDCRNEWKEKYDTLKASHDKLKKYVQHQSSCGAVKGETSECTCGFKQALEEAGDL